MFNLRHDIRFDKSHLNSWNSTLFGSYVNHLMDNLLKPLDPRMLNASTSATTYNYGGRTEGFWTFGNNSLFSGLDFRREGAEGIRTREYLMGPNAGNTFYDNAWQDGHIAKGSLFAEFHLKKGQTQYVLSTRLELNQANINEATSEFKEINQDNQVTQINPNLSAGATHKINEKLNFGLWLGRAQRSASLTERYINFFPVGQDPYELVGNPQLKPEVNNQFDIILDWKNKFTKLEVDVFAGYLQNFISSFIEPNTDPRLPNSPGVRQFTNIDNAIKTGFEINWTQQLILGLQQQIGLAYTYAQD
ncbi:MAG: TonB-dependent receptor, partial [Croceitalea sp.]|nr:TonB-dependent receptor [Croceitalea sp.]